VLLKATAPGATTGANAGLAPAGRRHHDQSKTGSPTPGQPPGGEGARREPETGCQTGLSSTEIEGALPHGRDDRAEVRLRTVLVIAVSRV